jgi:hypothetical protein
MSLHADASSVAAMPSLWFTPGGAGVFPAQARTVCTATHTGVRLTAALYEHAAAGVAAAVAPVTRDAATTAATCQSLQQLGEAHAAAAQQAAHVADLGHVAPAVRAAAMTALAAVLDLRAALTVPPPQPGGVDMDGVQQAAEAVRVAAAALARACASAEVDARAAGQDTCSEGDIRARLDMGGFFG